MADIRSYNNLTPQIHPTAYVDSSSVIIGEVSLAAEVSIWPGVILRGDQGAILIGEQTNIQDKLLVERVQKGVSSPVYKPGPFNFS